MPGLPTVIASMMMAQRMKMLHEKYKAALGYGSIPAMAARQIVPWLIDKFKPKSVVDIGCGDASFLHEFKVCDYNNGIRVTGFDKKYTRHMKIDPSEFYGCDLNRGCITNIRADLCLCLEVGEHIKLEHARHLVALCKNVAPIVVFGAAIPGQGGWGHCNEQWQSYWVGLFDEFGYYAASDLRDTFWNNTSVAPWYSQNTLLYCKEHTQHNFGIKKFTSTIDVIHPELWKHRGLMGLLKRI